MTNLVGHRAFPPVIWAIGPVIRKLMCTIICTTRSLRRTVPHMTVLSEPETMFRLNIPQATLRWTLMTNPD